VALLRGVLKAILLQSRFVDGAILGSETPADFDVLPGERLLHHIPIGAPDEVLICGIALCPTAELGLRKWLASQKGKSFYQHALARRRESRSLELKVLVVTALLWRSRILGSDATAVWALRMAHIYGTSPCCCTVRPI